MISSSGSLCNVDTSSFLSMTFADRSFMYSIFLFDSPIVDLNTELGVESICSGKNGRELVLLLSLL
jgi:hypothetical protein